MPSLLSLGLRVSADEVARTDRVMTLFVVRASTLLMLLFRVVESSLATAMLVK
jgi:hypothetical protein